MSSLNVGLPKIAPNVYRRTKIQAWLEFHSNVALRFVSAPAGSGKTTVAVLYARSRAHAVGYVAVTREATSAEFHARIATAVGVDADGDYADLLVRLAAFPRLEIIVDDVDKASPEIRLALCRLYRDVADSVTMIYLARAPEAIAWDGGDAQGLVAVCDPGSFAFSSDEIALFAQALGLNEDPMSIARLHAGRSGGRRQSPVSASRRQQAEAACETPGRSGSGSHAGRSHQSWQML